MAKGKTVFILGAGFSKPAGFPLQREILQAIIDNPYLLGAGIFDSPEVPIKEFEKQRSRLVVFLNKVFRRKEQSLEDIFTLLDQTISERGALLDYSYTKLILLREQWIRCILFVLHACSARHLRQKKSPYFDFAEALINVRIKGKVNGDPFSIISLNWDSLLEDSLFSTLRRKRLLRQVDVDYCVYTTPMNMDTRFGPHMPGPKQKAAARLNTKILKLHGSATWLRCPSSGLVFTALGQKENPFDAYFTPRISPFLNKYKDPADKSKPSLLEPYIIAPTYAKVFDFPHIKTVWQSAYVELREATNVVFIGYSMPDSDYHFRTLLRRALLPGTAITVVLSQADDPTYAVTDRERQFLPESRYKQLFVTNPTFEYNGVEAFIQDYVLAST
jgi:hypothetical protein